MGGGAMLAKALTSAVVGLDGALVEVEVDVGYGLPSFTIVGLPDAAVQEARERVRAAVKNSVRLPAQAPHGQHGPRRPEKGRAVIRPPARRRAARRIPMTRCSRVERHALPRRASLDGSVRHTAGVLPMVALAERGMRQVFVPRDDAPRPVW